MKKVKAEYNARIDLNMECKRHSEQVSRFYCFNLDCRTHLCRICLKEHPKEHLPTLTTIENIKEKALTSIESQIENKVKKTLQTILRSDQMHRMFKETFFTLMKQNTTMNLDEEDVADIVADTLARKYFPQEISIPQMTEKNWTLTLEKRRLMSFDFEYDDSDYFPSDQDSDFGAEGEDNETENKKTRKWYEENKEYFSVKSSKFYGRNPLKVLHLESKYHTILWNAQYQKLYFSDGSKEEKKFTIPQPFNSLTILDLKGPLFIAAADRKLVLYYIANLENNQPLKLFKEILHIEIVFLESDSKKLLFVVSVTLEASIYRLSNKLDLQELAYFRLPDIPENVLMDSANGLLFIQYEDNILEVYRNFYQTPRLIKKFRDRKGIDFSWNQSSRKLLLLSSGKLYQFDKGNFKLLRVVDKSIECMDLTEFGIIAIDQNEKLCLISQKNLMKRKILPLPSIKDQMETLREERYHSIKSLVNERADKEIDKLEFYFNKIKLVAEDPTHLLIYLNVDYEQGARQQEDPELDDRERNIEFGGKIFTQWLLKYNLKQEKYQVSYQ